MGSLDDDDELEQFPFGHASRRRRGDDENDDWDDPDERDLVPDEMAMVRCQKCKKLILEDSVRCPYCKEMQLEQNHNRMPLWFIITAILLILITIAYYIFGVGDGAGYPHW